MERNASTTEVVRDVRAGGKHAGGARGTCFHPKASDIAGKRDELQAVDWASENGNGERPCAAL